MASKCISCGAPRTNTDTDADQWCIACRGSEHKLSVDQAGFEEFWASEKAVAATSRRDFGALLRCYREWHSPIMSQVALADSLGLSQAQVSRIESGKTMVNDLAKLSRWSQILGFSDKYLWFDHVTCGSTMSAYKARESNGTSQSGDAVGQSSMTDGTNQRLPRVRNAPHPPVSPLRAIGEGDVSALLETTRAFRQLDNRFGGGHVRSAVAVYLASEVEPALRAGRFSRYARRDFQRASAQLNQLVGWMAYDVGEDQNGRRYLRRALDISTEAQDIALHGEMLAAMSHQAAHSGRADEAIDFAISARQLSLRSGTPALQAESAALEAQGYAIQRDTVQCLRALRRAEHAFGRSSPENTPGWLQYFDRAYMSAKFAHALRDLGRPADAERFARESLQMCDGYERGRLFNTALLASVLASSGQVAEAASCAQLAVGMAGHVRSVRAWRYVDGVRAQLYPYRKSTELSETWPGLVALRPPEINGLKDEDRGDVKG